MLQDVKLRISERLEKIVDDNVLEGFNMCGGDPRKYLEQQVEMARRAKDGYGLDDINRGKLRMKIEAAQELVEKRGFRRRL